MEDKLVSKHILDASQYVGKGKWKGVIQGWVVFLIIYGITRIPNVQQAMLDFANSMKGVAWLSSGVNFIIHSLWIIAILLVIGTLITWKEKQPFMELQIYEDGIGFVTMFGKLERVEHNKVYFHYGKYQKTIFIDCAVLGISAHNIPWEYFSQADVLHKNLERYANWNMNKYQKN